MRRVGRCDSRGRDEVEVEFRAEPRVQFMEPVNVTAPSMTIVLACAIRATSSIQIGTPAAARGSIPLACSQGVVLSAISRTSTPRSLARTSALTMPESVVKP